MIPTFCFKELMSFFIYFIYIFNCPFVFLSVIFPFFFYLFIQVTSIWILTLLCFLLISFIFCLFFVSLFIFPPLIINWFTLLINVLLYSVFTCLFMELLFYCAERDVKEGLLTLILLVHYRSSHWRFSVKIVF